MKYFVLVDSSFCMKLMYSLRVNGISITFNSPGLITVIFFGFNVAIVVPPGFLT